MSELAKAIKSFLSNGKSPGPDGLTNDYYKVFQCDLCSTFTSVYFAAVTSAAFPAEMLQPYIVTILKPGKEPTTPSNSLINTNLKIYAKILAVRLLPILSFLINPDQTGFTSGRQASVATQKS